MESARKSLAVRGLSVAVLIWLVFAVWLTWSGCRTDLRKVDCIVVLGARSLPDGQPGPSLRARCDRGVELWRQGWAPHLLFTGGRGSSGTVEGEVGVAYARKRGVPESALRFEGQSHTTQENFHFAGRLMQQQGWRSCLVVSDPFHMPRSLSMARQVGLEAYPAPTFEGPGWRHWSSWSLYTVRETGAWIKYALTL